MINGKTKIYGIIGNPVEHSISPLIHNFAFKYYNLNSKYIPLFVNKNFKDNIVNSLKALNIYGVNVTIPYKSDVINQLDEIDPIAQKIKSVNTIVIDQNFKAKGYSTDFYGFCYKLKEQNIDLSKSKFLILGNGGASLAIVNSLQLLENNNNITIAGRSQEKLDIFNSKLHKKVDTVILNSEKFLDIFSNFEIIVNTTPVGMDPKINFSPIKEGLFNKNQIAYDIIYNPIQTKFLKDAKNCGAKTINGIYMLIYQASKSFEYWTNKQFPTDEIIKYLKDINIIGA